jgi:hypothetical protein
MPRPLSYRCRRDEASDEPSPWAVKRRWGYLGARDHRSAFAPGSMRSLTDYPRPDTRASVPSLARRPRPDATPSRRVPHAAAQHSSAWSETAGTAARQAARHPFPHLTLMGGGWRTPPGTRPNLHNTDSWQLAPLPQSSGTASKRNAATPGNYMAACSLAITDDGHRSALRSTRNRPRRAMRRRRRWSNAVKRSTNRPLPPREPL